MDYKFKEITIEYLVDLIDNEKVDLSPSYQRNFIWSPQDQSDLVDTIIKGYPLPSFFLYEKPNGYYEMVDGQQRSRTIYRFVKGLISSSRESGRIKYSLMIATQTLNYRLPFIFISNLSPKDSLKDFYVLINKKGKHLNTPEVNKSEFHDTNFLKLSEEVLSYQKLIDLDLFSDATSKRMNDRAYIEELLAYLKHGIKDKKDAVEIMYEKDIDNDEYNILINKFYQVIDLIAEINKVFPINKTRYKQKNDFYTLFNFVNENIDFDVNVLKYQYQILVLLSGSDQEGIQFIRPSNEECEPLREYANNCVTQSNSKTAREKRLSFFNAVLKNKDVSKNQVLSDLLRYLSQIYGNPKINLTRIDDFQLLNIEPLK